MGHINPLKLNTLRPRQNGRHFADDIFKYIFLNENVGIPIKISLKFVPKGRINNIPALVQIMAWRRLGDKPLSEPMMVSLPTHICATRPQWVLSITTTKHGKQTLECFDSFEELTIIIEIASPSCYTEEIHVWKMWWIIGSIHHPVWIQ